MLVQSNTLSPQVKQCTKCLIVKSESDFYFEKRYNRRRCDCKKCNDQARKQRREANPENARLYHQQYDKKRTGNIELGLKRKRQLKEARARNIEKIRAHDRQRAKTGLEKKREYAKGWRKRRPHIVKARKLRRIALERNAKGFCSSEQLKARIDYYGNRCWMCNRPAVDIDHVKPLAKGGSMWPSNLRPACKKCNRSKSDKWPVDLRSFTYQE